MDPLGGEEASQGGGNSFPGLKREGVFPNGSMRGSMAYNLQPVKGVCFQRGEAGPHFENPLFIGLGQHFAFGPRLGTKNAKKPMFIWPKVPWAKA